MNPTEEGGLCSSFPRPKRIFPENASPGCRFRDMSTKPGNAMRGQEGSLAVGLLLDRHKMRCFPQTSHGNCKQMDDVASARRKHNLCAKETLCPPEVVLHKSSTGASELGPLGKLAGFWSQALIGSVMAARNPSREWDQGRSVSKRHAPH